MEYLTPTESGIYQERDHILQKGMLNCLSRTASKQETFKATHDLTAGSAYSTTTAVLAIATFDSDRNTTRSISIL